MLRLRRKPKRRIGYLQYFVLIKIWILIIRMRQRSRYGNDLNRQETPWEQSLCNILTEGKFAPRRPDMFRIWICCLMSGCQSPPFSGKRYGVNESGADVSVFCVSAISTGSLCAVLGRTRRCAPLVDECINATVQCWIISNDVEMCGCLRWRIYAIFDEHLVLCSPYSVPSVFEHKIPMIS